MTKNNPTPTLSSFGKTKTKIPIKIANPAPIDSDNSAILPPF